MQAEPVQAARFRLLRYFTITTLIAFAAVGSALLVLEHMEGVFFAQVQREQQAFFTEAQAALARQHEETARASLVAVHEAGHVMLTRVVANMLWMSDFAPFVARAQQLPVEHCRGIPSAEGAAAAPARKACFAELGRRIMATPGFKALDAKAYAAMRSTRVFKIKVWDLRGVTVYSSEHAQIGEDGAANQGWRTAVAGNPASELTHRHRFSAFEGVVENRDLISTYVPVRDPRHGAVVGVFELYSDVTPFLEQIKAASRKFGDISTANDARIAQTSRANQDIVGDSSGRFLLIVGGLLVLLYSVSLLIVRHGQRIIDRQMLAQEQATRREQLWHREKMAALAAMAANVSHEVGNPLAVISGLAQHFPDESPNAGEQELQPARLIREQADRIEQMMRRLTAFTSARSDSPEWVDVNAMIKAVCDFSTFDQRFHRIPIEFRAAAPLPAREIVPDHLNEVMMNLLQACVDPGTRHARSRRVVVETELRGDDCIIRVTCHRENEGAESAPGDFRADTRFDAVRRRVRAMGGQLVFADASIEIVLPPSGPDAPG